LHERDQVSGAHADEGGRVGLSLGELQGERGRSGHAVGENHVAEDVDDGNCDGDVLFERLGLDAVSDVLRDGEQRFCSFDTTFLRENVRFGETIRC
jgi:hypothetical protein